DIALQTVAYGERLAKNGVTVSLHPAGHVLGSAQVRIEHGGRGWAISGGYKLEPAAACPPSEPVGCDGFAPGSAFGVPGFRWQPPAATFAQINAWWAGNAAAGRASVLFCYAFGKAQRVLAGVDATIGPIFCHGAVARLNDAYRMSNVALPPWHRVAEAAGP